MKPEVFIEVNMKIKDLEMEIAELLGTDISLSFEFSKPQQQKLTIEELGLQIVSGVCEFLSINENEMRSKTRGRDFIKAKEFILRFCLDYFNKPPLNKIAALISRDRSNMYNLKKSFNASYQLYQEYRDQYNAVQSYLYTRIRNYEQLKRK